MNFFKYFILLIIFLITISCSKDKVKKSVINEKNLDAQVFEAYQKGMDSLEAGAVSFRLTDKITRILSLGTLC